MDFLSGEKVACLISVNYAIFPLEKLLASLKIVLRQFRRKTPLKSLCLKSKSALEYQLFMDISSLLARIKFLIFFWLGNQFLKKKERKEKEQFLELNTFSLEDNELRQNPEWVIFLSHGLME